jgi:hypothetical protein
MGPDIRWGPPKSAWPIDGRESAYIVIFVVARGTPVTTLVDE